MREYVVCLGAGKSQLELITKAKSLGYAVIAIDQNTESPGFRIADEVLNESTHNTEAILSRLKGLNLKGLLARSTGNALFTAARIVEEFGVPGVNIELAKISTSKSELRKFAQQNKIRMPHGYKVNDFNAMIEYKLARNVIVKPDFTVVGKKSISKVNIDDKYKLRNAVDSAIASSGNGFAEIDEFIDGYDCSYLTWIEKGTPSILLSWDELIGFDNNSNLFQYGVSMPSISTIVNHFQEIERVITGFAELFPSTRALVSFSFRVDETGNPWLIELHADMTGDSILDKLAPVSTNKDCLFEITKMFIEGEFSELNSSDNKFEQLPSAILYSKSSATLENNVILQKENLNSLFTEILPLIGVSSIEQKKFLNMV
jgi:hypothetical protein